MQHHASLGGTIFTEQERDYCAGQPRPEEHLAARFCAKEAVIKALGIDGWDPLDVEIVSGGPDVHVQLHGEVAATAAELGLTITVSMTHLASVAGAVALARPSD
jgi:holo-[acyl-carrier protein] synthase